MRSESDWQVAAPEDAGMDAGPLSAVADWLDELAGANVHSLLVARQGRLVFEHYRKGPDQRWGETLPEAEHGVESLHDLRSVTKVVTGLLVGQALDAKLIPGLDTPVFDCLPDHAELRTPAKHGITVRHLLTMSAGLAWDENLPISDPKHGEMRLWRSEDPVRTALEPSLVAKPGEVWNYAGGCTEILAAILERAAGRPLDVFARETLFAPLGIAETEWARLKNGAPSASGGLRMRARDLAKLGQLVLRRGRWGGEALLSEDWIAAALSPQIGAPDRLFFYGYHWWLGRSLFRGREVAWAAGIGLGGQRLIVVPDLDLVVVITAGHYADGLQAWLPLTILNRFVLASVR